MTDSIRTTLDRNLSFVPTVPRATAPDAGQRFRDALAGAAQAAVGGLSSILPGSAGLLSNVVATPAGGATRAATAGLSSEANSSSGLARESADQALELLAIQQSIGLEQRQFTTVSNVMKARHDTAKNVVGNFR